MTTKSTTAAVPPLSQSRYELMACPELYIARVMEGHQEPPNEPALRGQRIHKVLADYVNYLVRERKTSDPDYFDFLSSPYTGETKEILEHSRDLVIDPDRVLGTEMYLSLNENLEPLLDEMLYGGSGEAPSFEGTLDLVMAPDPTTIDIVDYKSYYAIIDPDTFQSKLYPLLAFKHFPDCEMVRFTLDFVRYGAKRQVTYTRSQDLPQLERLAKSARQQQVALHESGISEALPGPHCCYCSLLRNGCPIAAINPYQEQSPEDRAKFALWLAAAKKENDRILKDFAKVQPITITDGNGTKYEAGYKLTERTKYPLEPTVSELSAWRQTTGEDLSDKLCVGATELKPLLRAKKRSGLAAAFEMIAVKTPSTRFAITGVEEEED